MNNDDYKPMGEQNYPPFNWKLVWKSIFNQHVDADSQVIVYRYVHDTLQQVGGSYMGILYIQYTRSIENSATWCNIPAPLSCRSLVAFKPLSGRLYVLDISQENTCHSCG